MGVNRLWTRPSRVVNVRGGAAVAEVVAFDGLLARAEAGILKAGVALRRRRPLAPLERVVCAVVLLGRERERKLGSRREAPARGGVGERRLARIHHHVEHAATARRGCVARATLLRLRLLMESSDGGAAVHAALEVRARHLGVIRFAGEAKVERIRANARGEGIVAAVPEALRDSVTYSLACRCEAGICVDPGRATVRAAIPVSTSRIEDLAHRRVEGPQPIARHHEDDVARAIPLIPLHCLAPAGNADAIEALASGPCAVRLKDA